jgi:hypothetical protein
MGHKARGPRTASEERTEGNSNDGCDHFTFFIMFIHTNEKKIQCRYESPREETREEHG